MVSCHVLFLCQPTFLRVFHPGDLPCPASILVLHDSPHIIPAKPSRWSRLLQRHWGEPLAFAFICAGGLLFSVISIWTWAIPQLILLQEFESVRGQVIDTRIARIGTQSDRLFCPEILVEYPGGTTTFRGWGYDYQTLLAQINGKKSAARGFTNELAAQKALSGFIPGKTVEVRVRMGSPEQLIVAWRFSRWNAFFLLLSLFLVVLGFVGFSLTFRLESTSIERRLAPRKTKAGNILRLTAETPPLPDWPTVPDGQMINESNGTHLQYRLPLSNQPVFPLLGLAVIASVWILVSYGILFHFFLLSTNSWTDRAVELAFRGLFFGMGVLLAIWVARQLLQTFRFSPTLLEISDHPIFPGRRYRVLLSHSGGLRIRQLRVEIVSKEVARFHQGTDTVTSLKDVFQQELFSRSDFETSVDQPLRAEFSVLLPLGAMHSFRQENNEIAWQLVLTMQMEGQRVFRREFPIIVRPVLLNDLGMEGNDL